MRAIDAKTKSALTRAVNKSTHLLPYSGEEFKKAKKRAAAVADDGGRMVRAHLA